MAQIATLSARVARVARVARRSRAASGVTWHEWRSRRGQTPATHANRIADPVNRHALAKGDSLLPVRFDRMQSAAAVRAEAAPSRRGWGETFRRMRLSSVFVTTASALISLVVAVVVLLASFRQWWDIGFDGEMRTRRWVKVLFGGCIISLVIAAVFLIASAL